MLKRSLFVLEIVQSAIIVAVALSFPPEYREFMIFLLSLNFGVMFYTIGRSLYAQYQTRKMAHLITELSAEKVRNGIEQMDILLETTRTKTLPMLEVYTSPAMQKKYLFRLQEIQETHTSLQDDYLRLLADRNTCPVTRRRYAADYERITRMYEVVDSHLSTNLQALVDLSNETFKYMQLAATTLELAALAQAHLSDTYDMLVDARKGPAYRVLEEMYTSNAAKAAELHRCLEARNYITARRLSQEVLETSKQIRQAMQPKSA